MAQPEDPIACDLAVVGAGAAGLMAAISAGRALRDHAARGRVVVLDGAARIGAKILVAGGGRCNVTHHRVDERDFSGSTPAAIRKVLRRFDVPAVVELFRDLGVVLKREDTGKLFPTTDSARTVLDALLRAAREAGVELRHPWRVERIERADRDPAGAPARFRLGGPGGVLLATRVVLATGGRSLPKSGSDGAGYAIAQSLGHSLTPRVFPALVPLTLPRDHFLCALAGVSADVDLHLRSATGARLASFRGSLLCAHFGVSGPVVLDASRHWIDARAGDPSAQLAVSWLPGETPESADRDLLAQSASGASLGAGRWLRERGLAQRLAEALCRAAALDPATRISALSRERRRALARAATDLVLPITGDRGFTHAEVTAGGVPLRELDLATLESRVCPGLHLAGEICDVDGRIGGFNFQWAWASGHVAGTAAADALAQPSHPPRSGQPPARPI